MKHEQEIAVVTPSPTPNRAALLLCKVGIHSWHYSHWERQCRRCDTVQHIWRIFGRVIEWRNEAAISGSAAITEMLEMELPLPLRRWRCGNCTRTVMRVHPPGHFERCPRCGKEGFAGREQKKSFPIT